MIYHGVGKNQSGFTLIELIVVIVVIGILAVIAVVGYNGIQQRAQNASLSSAANNTIKGLRLYYAENGRYPFPTDVSPSNSSVCIGTNTDLPAQGDLATGQCFNGPAGGFVEGGRAYVSQSFNAQLGEAIGQSPASSIAYKGPTSWNSNSASVRGLMYQASGTGTVVDGSAAYLFFFLKGSGQSCDIGVKGFAFTVVDAGPVSGATQCVFQLDSSG